MSLLGFDGSARKSRVPAARAGRMRESGELSAHNTQQGSREAVKFKNCGGFFVERQRATDHMFHMFSEANGCLSARGILLHVAGA